MCSYNAVNGVPMCANAKLLNATLRNTWGFNGYVLHTWFDNCDSRKMNPQEAGFVLISHLGPGTVCVGDCRYVTSDCDAVGDVYTPEPAGHGYASPLDAVAMSLKAGTDMDCGDWGKHAYLSQLPAAVKAGKVSEADLDKALLRLTTLQMELGLFDPKADSHFFTLGVDLIHSDEHTRHALEASQVNA